MRGYANWVTFEVPPVEGEVRTIAGVPCTYDVRTAGPSYRGESGPLTVYAIPREGTWGVVLGHTDPDSYATVIGVASHVDLDTATAYALEDLTRHAVQAFARELAS